MITRVNGACASESVSSTAGRGKKAMVIRPNNASSAGLRPNPGFVRV